MGGKEREWGRKVRGGKERSRLAFSFLIFPRVEEYDACNSFPAPHSTSKMNLSFYLQIPSSKQTAIVLSLSGFPNFPKQHVLYACSSYMMAEQEQPDTMLIQIPESPSVCIRT